MTTKTVESLREKHDLILTYWISQREMADDFGGNFNSSDDLKAQSSELLEIVLKTITPENITDPYSPDLQPLFDYISGLTISRAKQGFSPRETATYIFSLKDALLRALGEIITDDTQELYRTTLEVSKFVDNIGITSFETFIKGREEVILSQADEMAELSTPVIKVWDGIIAMPIIGTLDSARTQVVMENLLQGIVDSESSIAILDISGVPAVDSLVAQHLIKTVNAIRLLGADCVISGIRPEIAQTVVHLGIDLSKMVTKATLASALKYSLTTLQLEVRRVQKDKSN
ncbi:STAS domain-containing protein [Dyadobacter sp. CY261]|uniref:STAS domain-containing protein n=1 Tax=Dyadobacter sp. CY261 TaxID=2907203 RepID=UPI001F2AC45C|nr:STAS domain-containing protein [Dyadobacter sp. CY261]MCF0073003.1 STAS domain-containing protein [Dyadobacter sp. CY261]